MGAWGRYCDDKRREHPGSDTFDPTKVASSSPMNTSSVPSWPAFIPIRMPTTDDSDGLIRRWQQGDFAAFAVLVARWQQPMGRFLARLVGPAQAPDLAQEVFLKLYRSAALYQPQGHFQAWLYRLALNLARDYHRRVAARPALQTWDGQDAPNEDHAAAQVLVR